jgi:hypothetical protein
MTSLPRNRVVAYRNLHRNDRLNKSAIKKDIISLDSIRTKYGIKELTFRTVKFVGRDGIVMETNHSGVTGNLQSGVIIITSPNLSTESNNVYDLITIKRNKMESDRKKAIEKNEKNQLEMDRIKKQIENRVSLTVDSPVGEPNNPIVGEPDSPIIGEPNISIVKKPDNSVVEEQDSSVIREPDSPVIGELDSPVIEEPDSSVIREVNSLSIFPKPQIPIKYPKKNTGNKFFRNFMKDIKGKFKLEFQDKYDFCEFRKDATDMVIDNVDIYKINISTKETHYLIIGDLQMKSMLIRQIDPSYEIDHTTDEHNSFIEKIQNMKTND